MQTDRIAGRVRGLGVCDVLRVELDAEQQLDAGFAALERRYATEPEVIRLLAAMRAAPPLIGPAGLVLELVRACLADAVARLATALEAPGGLQSAELTCAAAWAATALDCVAVDGFSFEPGADPAHAW